MARQCIVCGKGTTTGMNVSHSHIRTKRKLLANVQKVRIMVNGTPTRGYVCTKCLKAGKVTRAV